MPTQNPETAAASYITKRKAKRTRKKTAIKVKTPKPKISKIPELTFVRLFEYHNEQGRTLLAYNTLKHYYVTQRYLIKYIQEKYAQQDIKLAKLDYQFIADFETFLYNIKPMDHQKQLHINGVLKHMTRVMKMINLAINLNWINNNPFKGYKMRRTEVDKGFLNRIELQRIEKQQIATQRLIAVRDMFIFSCYTGLAFADMSTLRPEHIVTGMDGGLWIKLHRQKTDTPVSTPLLPVALKLIAQYKSKIERRKNRGIFPVISNQKMNAYLKEIAMICGIKKNLTYHLARHTFATTVTLSNGVPIETVSKMLGHTKLSTTQIYARVLDDKISRDMETLREKLKSTC